MPMDGVLLNRITDNLNRACRKLTVSINPLKQIFIFQTFGTENRDCLYLCIRCIAHTFHQFQNDINLELTHFLGILRKISRWWHY